MALRVREVSRAIEDEMGPDLAGTSGGSFLYAPVKRTAGLILLGPESWAMQQIATVDI